MSDVVQYLKMMSVPGIVTIETRNLSADGLVVRRGYDEQMIDTIIELSKQPHVMNHAPRDHAERFTDQEAAMRWLEGRERVIYSLAHSAHVAGLLWFTRTPRYGAEYTFAIRMYEPYVGFGMGVPFAQKAHADFTADYNGALWADISVENIASQRLASKLSYEKVLEDRSEAAEGRINVLRPAGVTIPDVLD
jgi:hypothetical protein